MVVGKLRFNEIDKEGDQLTLKIGRALSFLRGHDAHWGTPALMANILLATRLEAVMEGKN